MREKVTRSIFGPSFWNMTFEFYTIMAVSGYLKIKNRDKASRFIIEIKTTLSVLQSPFPTDLSQQSPSADNFTL